MYQDSSDIDVSAPRLGVAAQRQKLPRHRQSRTFSFDVAGCDGYATVGEYEDGRPGEIFIRVAKQGSTLAGIMDAFSIAVSLGLQHGVPLASFVDQFSHMRFEPAGMTDDKDIRFASSLMDYIFRKLALDYMSLAERMEFGVFSIGERTDPTLPGMLNASSVGQSSLTNRADGPTCARCDVVMEQSGSRYACPACGGTT